MHSGVEVAKPEYPRYDLEGKSIAFEGTYGEVVDRVGNAVNAGQPLGYWDPGLLVNGLLDFKIENPDAIRDVPSLVTIAKRTALELHAGTLTVEQFGTFRDEVNSIVNPSLRASEFSLSEDRMTYDASRPNYCAAAAESLRVLTQGEDILMIPLGHGGITAGLVTFGHYAQRGKAKQSSIYPVRFSKYKAGDMHPRIDDRELAYLKELTAERSMVVVFNEAHISGSTIETATAFFGQVLDTAPLAAHIL